MNIRAVVIHMPGVHAQQCIHNCTILCQKINTNATLRKERNIDYIMQATGNDLMLIHLFIYKHCFSSMLQ